MKFTEKLGMLGICPLLVVLALSTGCSNPASNPAAPQAPAPTPSFNYGLNIFFGNSGPSTISGPFGIRLSGGTLWIAQYTGENVEAWTTDGVFSRAVTGYNSVTFNGPSADGVGPDGNLYVTDANNSQVVVFNPTGQWLTTFGKPELGTDFPDGVAVNSTYAFVLDNTTPQFIRYTISGMGNTKTFGSPVTYGTIATSGASGALSNPQNLTADSQFVYICDAAKHAVMKYDNSGVYQGSVTATGLAYPIDVQVDASGYYYVVDNTNHNIQVFNPSGAAVTHFGDTALISPYGLTLDPSGNIYVIDYGQNLVVTFRKQ